MKKAVISNLKGVPLNVTVTLTDGILVFANVHSCKTVEHGDNTFLQISCPDGSVTRINLDRVVLYDVHEHGSEDIVTGKRSGGITLFDYSDYIYGEEDSDDERADDNGKN